jgi:hypothetical protein
MIMSLYNSLWAPFVSLSNSERYHRSFYIDQLCKCQCWCGNYDSVQIVSTFSVHSVLCITPQEEVLSMVKLNSSWRSCHGPISSSPPSWQVGF